MTYWPTIKTQSANSTSIDAFARSRVSNPTTIFDYSSQYDSGALFWDTVNVGGGAITHLPNESSVQLSTGDGNINSSCVRQTLEYFRYQPGKSQLIAMTGVMGAKKAGVRQRIGYFDGYNGVFFEQDENNLKIVVRSYTSGSVVDGYVNQSSWNTDKLDGYGSSGILLDTTKANIFWFDLEWLGVGRVRFGIWGPDGVPILCHDAQHANSLTAVYMTTANLPLRYEITNTGSAGTATTMKQICSTVISEGGESRERAHIFAASNGITARSPTTRRAVLSIRPKLLFNSITNRGKIIPAAFEISAGSANIFWELIYNPTFTTSGGALTWTDADATNSIVEYCTHGDANSGAFTGGIVLDSGYAISSSGGVRGLLSQSINAKYSLVLDAAGANPRALTIACTAVSGSPTALCGMNWEEIR